jgi:hypothetical protein
VVLAAIEELYSVVLRASTARCAMIFVQKFVLTLHGTYWSDSKGGTWVPDIRKSKWFRTESEAEKQAGVIEAAFEAEIDTDEFVDIVTILVNLD